MYCPKCGQEAGDYTRICPACGELLDNTPVSPQPEQSNNYYPPNSGFPRIPDYKVQSILLIVFSSILCCFTCISILALPFAIVALVTSNKIQTHLSAGNPDLAMEESKKTKMWCWISFGILIACLVLYAVYLVFFFNSSYFQEILDQMKDLQYYYEY